MRILKVCWKKVEDWRISRTDLLVIWLLTGRHRHPTQVDSRLVCQALSWVNGWDTNTIVFWHFNPMSSVHLILYSFAQGKKKKPKVHKRRHSRTVAVKDLRGNYQGKDILQTPGRNWGGGDTDTTTTLLQTLFWGEDTEENWQIRKCMRRHQKGGNGSKEKTATKYKRWETSTTFTTKHTKDGIERYNR